MVQRWKYQELPNADEILTQQCNHVITSLLKSPPEISIKNIKDTRSLHKVIFEQLVKDDQKHFAGSYRGDDYPELIHRTGSRQIELFPEVFVEHAFAKPNTIITEIEKLGYNIDYLYENRNILEKQHYFSIAVETLIRFFLIHPYVNGNGHIGRIIMSYLMRVADITMDESWTIHPRPYTNAIAVCMFTYSKYPIIAEQYFRQWFHLPNSVMVGKSEKNDSDSCSQPCPNADSDSDSDKSLDEDSDSDSNSNPQNLFCPSRLYLDYHEISHKIINQRF